MENWTRTESRLVRPFTSADATLDEVRFKLRANDEFDERTSFDPPDPADGDFQPEFELNFNASSLDNKLKALEQHLSLIIRLSDAPLHRSEIVFEQAIHDLPRTWRIPAESKHRFSWSAGFTASVALVLRHSRNPEPGLPFLRGHWVARKVFRIRSQKQQRAFRIEPWTGDDFARNGLPRDVVYWINFLTDELNQRFDDPGEAFRVYMRNDVFHALCDMEDSNSGRAVLKLISADVIAEIVWRGLKDLAPDEEIEPDGLLGAMIRSVTGKTRTSVEQLRRLASDNDFSSIRAYAQAAVGARLELARLSMRG